MPKYYVRSGELERIVVTVTPEGAAYKSVCQSNGEQLDRFFYIDERGFRGPIPSDGSFISDLLPEHVLDTQQMLSKWEGDNDICP